MTNETMNTNVKPAKVTKTIKISTKKSILIKFALIQFFGLLLLAIAVITVAILFTRNKAEAASESEAETKTEIQYVEVEKPVEKIVEKEVEVKVVDQEAVNNLANEKANELFEDYKANYEPETVTVEVEKIIEVVDQEATQALATEMANQMFEEYKTEYTEAQEATRVANLSTIYVHVYGGSGESNSFYLAINGSLYDRLTYAMIYEVLKTDARFEGYKVRSIANKDAVELFVGENYTSTRAIRIELK